MKSLMLYVAIVGVIFFACSGDNERLFGPTAPDFAEPLSAGKHNPRAIPDTCYAIVWDFVPDVVYSLFYGDYRFQVQEDRMVHIEEYFEPNRYKSYIAGTRHYNPKFHNWVELDLSDTDVDSLRTDALTDSTRNPIIYLSNIKFYYRSLPRHRQYRVAENDTTYRIARIMPDSSVVPVEFSDFNRRFRDIVPPPSIGEELYFLPVNLDTMAWMDAGAGDIRPFLRKVITEVDCPIPLVVLSLDRGETSEGYESVVGDSEVGRPTDDNQNQVIVQTGLHTHPGADHDHYVCPANYTDTVVIKHRHGGGQEGGRGKGDDDYPDTFLQVEEGPDPPTSSEIAAQEAAHDAKHYRDYTDTGLDVCVKGLDSNGNEKILEGCGRADEYSHKHPMRCHFRELTHKHD